MSACEPQDWASHFFENQDDLFRLLTKMVGDPDIAKDLVQDTYIRVSQGNSVNGVKNPRAYLITIASNLARDFLRKRTVRAEVGDEDGRIESIPSQVVSHERRIYDRQRLAMVEQAIKELPAKCREAFILRKIEGLSTDEIAQRMGVSRNMVEKNLRKALNLTREYMKKNDH